MYSLKNYIKSNNHKVSSSGQVEWPSHSDNSFIHICHWRAATKPGRDFYMPYLLWHMTSFYAVLSKKISTPKKELHVLKTNKLEEPTICSNSDQQELQPQQ